MEAGGQSHGATGRALSPFHAPHKLSLNFLICYMGLRTRECQRQKGTQRVMPTGLSYREDTVRVLERGRKLSKIA